MSQPLVLVHHMLVAHHMQVQGRHKHRAAGQRLEGVRHTQVCRRQVLRPLGCSHKVLQLVHRRAVATPSHLMWMQHLAGQRCRLLMGPATAPHIVIEALCVKLVIDRQPAAVRWTTHQL